MAVKLASVLLRRDLLARYPSPQAMSTAGRARLVTRMRKRAPRIAERLADDIVAALSEQTVVMTGTAAATRVLSAPC